MLSSCSSINYQSGNDRVKDNLLVYSHSFEDQQELPNKLIISDQYLQTNNRIFIVNQNWVSTYSQLVEYDLKTSTIVNNISSFDGVNEKISETFNDNSHIVFTVRRKKDNKNYEDIYLYNIVNKEKIMIKDNILTSIEDKYPGNLYVTISNNSVFWINPDFENNKSVIMEYNIVDHTTKSIHEQSFLNKGFMNHIPITFLSVSANYLLFNNRSTNANDTLIFLDLNTKKVINKIKIPKEYEFTYYGTIDDKEKCIYLYGRTKDNELIYRYNIKTFTDQKLIGIMERSYIMKNRIYFSDNQLFYSIQQDFTGDIRDHYFSEIYDLINYKTKRLNYVFNFVKTNNYFAYLEFDKDEGPNKMNLMIYQIKQN